jgi:hypothetical protein
MFAGKCKGLSSTRLPPTTARSSICSRYESVAVDGFTVPVLLYWYGICGWASFGGLRLIPVSTSVVNTGSPIVVQISPLAFSAHSILNDNYRVVVSKIYFGEGIALRAIAKQAQRIDENDSLGCRSFIERRGVGGRSL